MAEEETRQKREEESESEEEEDDVVETIPKVEIDPSKLTPLSPEVISKQVSTGIICFVCYASNIFVQKATINLGNTDLKPSQVVLYLILDIQVLLDMSRMGNRRW